MKESNYEVPHNQRNWLIKFGNSLDYLFVNTLHTQNILLTLILAVFSNAEFVFDKNFFQQIVDFVVSCKCFLTMG